MKLDYFDLKIGRMTGNSVLELLEIHTGWKGKIKLSVYNPFLCRVQLCFHLLSDSLFTWFYFSILTLSELFSECFSIGNRFIVDLGEVDLADPGAGHRHPFLIISAAGLDPLLELNMTLC
jgi:hypothetical protein